MPPDPAGRPRGPGGWTRAFGRFWWGFLVGDTPELFVGGVAAVGVTAGVAAAAGGTAAVAVLPVLVVAVVAVSLRRALPR